MMRIAQPFYEGLDRGELLLPWCNSCRKPHFYPRSACPHCWSEDYEWRPAIGSGTLYSFTAVRANAPSTFTPVLPYLIGIVDLDEGVRMLGNLIGAAHRWAIGDRVQVTFITRNGVPLPAFRRSE